MMIEVFKICRECKEEMKGRSDKKFCSDQCRNTFNNRLNSDDIRLVRNTNRILKKNRRIILNLIKLKDEIIVNREILVMHGFEFNHFTSLAQKSGMSMIYYCYDLGYEKLGGEKYRLVRKGK